MCECEPWRMALGEIGSVVDFLRLLTLASTEGRTARDVVSGTFKDEINNSNLKDETSDDEIPDPGNSWLN